MDGTKQIWTYLDSVHENRVTHRKEEMILKCEDDLDNKGYQVRQLTYLGIIKRDGCTIQVNQ